MDGNRLFHRVGAARSATRSRRWAALLTAAATLAATLVVASAPPVRAAVCDTSWTGLAGDGRWTTPGNWSAGVPTSSSNACLPVGSYTVSIIGESVQAKSLTIAAGPTLSIDELNCGPISAFLTLYGDSTNAGTINLANINDACGGTAQLTIISPFTLTNTGTIATTGCCRGDRELTGSVTNKGTVNVNHNGSNLVLHLDGAGLFDNQGTVTIGDSRTLVVSGGTGLEFRNDSGGSIAGNGITGQLILNNGNTFTQGAGMTSGNPVLINGGATLQFTGSGASSFDLRGDGGPNTISGSTIAGGQTVTINIHGCGVVSSVANLAGSMTNAGTINLGNADNGCGGTAQLVIPSGSTLTNTGTIATTGCCRGDRELTGSVTNKGTLNVNHNGSNLFLHLDGAGLFDNQGTVTIGDSRTLVVSGGTGLEFRNDSGGSIAGNGITGQLILNNGNTFTQGAGTTSGNPVLINGGATLHFTGGGASTFDLRGDGGPNTISGSTIAAGQTVTINIHGCGPVSSVANLAGSMTNAGTINLGNADDGCSGMAQLVIPSGSTLTNTGTIATTGCCRGDRELTGSVTNKGTVNVNHNGSNLFLHLDGAGLFDNQGTVTIGGSRTLTNTNDTVIVEPGATLGGPGSYAQGSPATLGVTVDAVHNTFTGIFCGETVSVDGTLKVTTLGTPTFGSTWPIITCAGGRTGTFATYNFGGTNYTVLYPPNGVTLVALRPSDPAITASATTFAATEGQSFSGQVATFTDPDTAAMSSEYSATIDWGDATGTTTGTVSGASGTFSVSGTHTYAEESTYQVTVTITDIDNSSNSATAHSTANVGDAALSSKCAMPQFTQPSYAGPTATFTDASSTGALSDFSATINWGDGPSTSGTIAGGPGMAPYTVSGSHTYTSTGSFTVATTIKDVGGSSTTATCTVIVFAFPTSNQATFVIGDLEATLLNSVTWWSSQWAKLNPMSGGPAPSSMKGFSGFEDNPLGLPPACGGSWTTDTGNATPPPPSVPEFMGVIVSSRITQSGSVVSGDIKEIDIVKNNPGYAPNPGHPGTGTVVAVVCRG